MIAAVETSPWFDNHPDQAGLWVIEYASERFAVLGLGRIADGRVKAHLASITNYRQRPTVRATHPARTYDPSIATHPAAGL